VTPILLETTFWEVVWWMIMVFFFTMAIWVFISIFADIFRRDDLSGIMKAVWIFVLFIIPFLGALIYLIFRPKMTAQDQRMIEEYETRQRRMAGYSATDEIAKAQALKDSGAISAEEFENLKKKALM
jgi:hypothetical protein